MRAALSSRTLAASSSRSSAFYAATRHHSSAASSSSLPWQPALEPGVSPAYDEALAYLKAHKEDRLSRLEDIRKSNEGLTAAQRRQMESLEVDALVNDPATRSKFRETQGVGQMDSPVIRHLAERRWKKEGGLDLIMGRVFQNKLVPDLVSDLAPTYPLTMSVAEGSIEPGLTLPSSLFEKPPRITFQPFHHPSDPKSNDPTPTALYTLLAIDLDDPSTSTHSFSQRLHYLKVNIPLSVMSGEIDLFSSVGEEVIAWEPPAPAQGSPKHRYVFVLQRQVGKLPLSSKLTETSRSSFDLRKYMAGQGVSPASIVGISLLRSEWTQEDARYIDGIWREYRGQRAPAFTKTRSLEAYEKPPSALQKRAFAVRKQAWEAAMADMETVGLADGVSEAADAELERDARQEKRTDIPA